MFSVSLRNETAAVCTAEVSQNKFICTRSITPVTQYRLIPGASLSLYTGSADSVCMLTADNKVQKYADRV